MSQFITENYLYTDDIYIDEEGYYVDANGFYVDENGYYIDEYGQYVTEGIIDYIGRGAKRAEDFLVGDFRRAKKADKAAKKLAKRARSYEKQAADADEIGAKSLARDNIENAEKNYRFSKNASHFANKRRAIGALKLGGATVGTGVAVDKLT